MITGGDSGIGRAVALAYGLAQELIDRGIRVNAVAPGAVWTPIIPASMSGEKTARFGGSSPTGRPERKVDDLRAAAGRSEDVPSPRDEPGDRGAIEPE